MIGYLKMMGAAVIITAGTLLYFHIESMRTELDIKTAELAKNEIIIDGLSSSLLSLEVDIEEAAIRIERVEKSRKASKDRLDKLENTIAKHDLARLRNGKPELIRRVYERGTNRYYDNIQEIMEK